LLLLLLLLHLLLLHLLLLPAAHRLPVRGRRPLAELVRQGVTRSGRRSPHRVGVVRVC
jgi:hypothetical protein